jgi:hypothetical protein
MNFFAKKWGGKMKSFWTGSIIAIIIAIVAGAVLNSTENSSAQKFSTSSTRL